MYCLLHTGLFTQQLSAYQKTLQQDSDIVTTNKCQFLSQAVKLTRLTYRKSALE